MKKPKSLPFYQFLFVLLLVVLLLSLVPPRSRCSNAVKPKPYGLKRTTLCWSRSFRLSSKPPSDSIGGADSKPQAAHRFHQGTPDLGSQTLDRGIHQSLIDAVGILPDMLEQPGSGQHSVAMLE